MAALDWITWSPAVSAYASGSVNATMRPIWCGCSTENNRKRAAMPTPAVAANASPVASLERVHSE